MKPIASFSLQIGNDSIEVLLASPECTMDYSAVIGESRTLGLVPASKEIVQKFLEQHPRVIKSLGWGWDVQAILALGSLDINEFGKCSAFPLVRITESEPQWEDGHYLMEQPSQTRKSTCELALLVQPSNHGSEVVTA